jgi:hypothetical protein
VAGVDSASRDISNAPIPVTLTLAQRARTLTIYAPLKGAAPLSSDSSASSLLVPVPDYPIVVEITP